MADITKKHVKAVGRYGVRYGRRNRQKVANLEVEQKKKHPCPYCKYPKVKRLSAGIWQCDKCKAKFTSRAYTVGKTAAVKSA
ncbi:MAG: 50S ribosomal protein L37ae [Candidatus Woesearchaeota archaeon]